MLVTRQLIRALALALPLAVAAYPQAMINYGAAVAAGTTAGATAGKHASDALTNALNAAASTGKVASEAAAKAEAQMMVEQPKPEDYKSVVRPANMPRAGGAVPLPVAGGRRKAARSGEVALMASAAGTLRSGANNMPLSIEEPAPQALWSADLPLTMQWALAEIRPVLAPMAERAQSLARGNSRDDVQRVLGKPASRVVIPGESDVNEIYYFQEKGRNVATVRLEAGSVTTVSVDSL